MALTPEQKEQVSTWVAAGDSLSVVQSKLASEMQISMTFMDVRFLVDDLNLELKDPKPLPSTRDLNKVQAPTPAKTATQASENDAQPEDDEALGEDAVPATPAGLGSVSVSVDRVVLIPGAMASGSATFSDGVTAKWIVDQYGRPGFTEVSQPGYRPSPEDAQAFMRELTAAIQGPAY